jgi:hypothetical protein
MTLTTESIPGQLPSTLPDPVLHGHLLRLLTGGLASPATAARATRRRADRYRTFLDALGVAV